MQISEIFENLLETYKHYFNMFYLYRSNDEVELAHAYLQDKYSEFYKFFSSIKKTIAVQCRICMNEIDPAVYLSKIHDMDERDANKLYIQICDTSERFGEEAVTLELNSIFTDPDPLSSG